MKTREEFFGEIFTRDDITPEAVDEFARTCRNDDDNFKTEVWREFAVYLFGLSLRKSQSLRKIVVNPAIRRLAWNMAGDLFSQRCTGIGRFVQVFPEMAERLWATGIQYPVSGDFITAFKADMTPDNITKLKLYDMSALAHLLSVCDPVGDWYYDLAAELLSKGAIQYAPLLHIFDRITQDKFEWTMDHLLKTKPKAYHKHIYATAMGSNKAGHEIIKKMKGYKGKTIKLTVPYSIPKSVSGEDLCNLLILLADSFVLDGNLQGLPTEKELKERALEVLLKGKQGLLNDAIDARDRLESIIQHGSTAMYALFQTLAALARTTPGFMDKKIIQHAVTTRSRDAIEAAPALLRLLNMVSDRRFTRITADNDYLWGERLTEKRARKLLQVLLGDGLKST